MWLKTHGANKLEDTCHFDAPMWRQLQKHEDFVYDDEVPDNCTAGYAITVQLRSHQFCGCLRSRRVILFSAHREAYGDFPVNYRVSNFWVEQLMQERPELIAPRGARCDYGYLTVPGTQLFKKCTCIEQEIQKCNALAFGFNSVFHVVIAFGSCRCVVSMRFGYCLFSLVVGPDIVSSAYANNSVCRRKHLCCFCLKLSAGG